MPVSKTTIERPGAYHEFWQDWCDGDGVKRLSPQALRTKIRKFIETYNVTASSFQKVIGVNANSYGKFMTGKYKDPWAATQNSTYWNAGYFFWSDERQAVDDSIVKKLKANASAATKAAAAGGGAGGGAAGKKPPLPDVTAIILTSNDVYLNPKEVRAEVSSLKARYKCSNADLAKAVWPAKASGSSQPGAAVGRFLGAGGDFGGEEMEFYRPCALFCEKVRVFENRPKTKKRKALEEEVETTGRAPFLGLNPNKKYLMCPGQSSDFTFSFTISILSTSPSSYTIVCCFVSASRASTIPVNQVFSSGQNTATRLFATRFFSAASIRIGRRTTPLGSMKWTSSSASTWCSTVPSS
tara:strand:- start:16 stop:1077 length:1062 start_codon:yes stop_codon:yes gene_type:complete